MRCIEEGPPSCLVVVGDLEPLALQIPQQGLKVDQVLLAAEGHHADLQRKPGPLWKYLRLRRMFGRTRSSTYLLLATGSCLGNAVGARSCLCPDHQLARHPPPLARNSAHKPLVVTNTHDLNPMRAERARLVS